MIDQVRPSQLAAWLEARAAGVQPLVLDVREPMELAVASVQPEGFELRHIPMHLIPQRLGELDPQRPVACLCHHGMRSMQVAMFLAQHDFEQIANIDGGIDAWSLQRDPSVPRY